jgi:ClpP class serine protease
LDGVAAGQQRCAVESARILVRARIEKGEGMEKVARSSWDRLSGAARTLFWIGLALIVAQQLCGPARTAAARADLLDRLQQERKSRVIAMIHRQDTVSVFGVSLSSSIGIEDSEAVLRAIRLTPPDQPIDLILHTPGGLVLAAEQIAHALVDRPGKVTVIVPHYAMSGGTLIALTADEILMDPNAVLGPVDPQIGDMPAASIVKLLELKPVGQISDEMLVMADVAQKARVQVASFVVETAAGPGIIDQLRAVSDDWLVELTLT